MCVVCTLVKQKCKERRGGKKQRILRIDLWIPTTHSTDSTVQMAMCIDDPLVVHSYAVQ